MTDDPKELDSKVEFLDLSIPRETRRTREDLLEDLMDQTDLVKSGKEVLSLALDSLDERGYKVTRIWAKDGEKYKLVAAADFPSALLEKEPSFSAHNELLEEILKREGEPAYFSDVTQVDSLMTGPIDPLKYVLSRYPEAIKMMTFAYSKFSDNPALRDFKGLLVVNYDLNDLKEIEVEKNGQLSKREAIYLRSIAKRVVAGKVFETIRSNREELTGLYNQRKFHSDWDRYMDRFYSTGETQGLINIDIDHFKTINDNYGHLAGDKFIDCMGELLRGMESRDVRPYRQGGDEFALVVRGDLGTVRQLGEKILDSIRNFNVPEILSVGSASIGIAMTEQGIMNGEEWFKRADNAVYASKDKGRNQIHVYGEYDSTPYLNLNKL